MMQKTPLTRSKPMRTAPAEPKPAAGPKPKACRVKFVPASPLAAVCGVPCAIEHGKAVTAKQKAKARSAERAKDRAQRDSLKTRGDWTREAQAAFNAFIRARDKLAGHPCISSSRPLDWSGNAVDAGHYRSTGSAPHLRFNEDNVHAQSKHDNQYKSGNAVDYRLGLIERIGLARVEALEADNAPRKWTHDELREIRDTYRLRAAQLKKEMAP